MLWRFVVLAPEVGGAGIGHMRRVIPDAGAPGAGILDEAFHGGPGTDIEKNPRFVDSVSPSADWVTQTAHMMTALLVRKTRTSAGLAVGTPTPRWNTFMFPARRSGAARFRRRHGGHRHAGIRDAGRQRDARIATRPHAHRHPARRAARRVVPGELPLIGRARRARVRLGRREMGYGHRGDLSEGVSKSCRRCDRCARTGAPYRR